jgi:hypothetical protein
MRPKGGPFQRDDYSLKAAWRRGSAKRFPDFTTEKQRDIRNPNAVFSSLTKVKREPMGHAS